MNTSDSVCPEWELVEILENGEAPGWEKQLSSASVPWLW